MCIFNLNWSNKLYWERSKTKKKKERKKKERKDNNCQKGKCKWDKSTPCKMLPRMIYNYVYKDKLFTGHIISRIVIKSYLQYLILKLYEKYKVKKLVSMAGAVSNWRPGTGIVFDLKIGFFFTLTFLYVVSPVSSTLRCPILDRGVGGFFSLSVDVKDCVRDILQKKEQNNV